MNNWKLKIYHAFWLACVRWDRPKILTTFTRCLIIDQKIQTSYILILTTLRDVGLLVCSFNKKKLKWNIIHFDTDYAKRCGIIGMFFQQKKIKHHTFWYRLRQEMCDYWDAKNKTLYLLVKLKFNACSRRLIVNLDDAPLRRKGFLDRAVRGVRAKKGSRGPS